MRLSVVLFIGAFAVATSAALHAAPADFTKDVQAFAEKHCYDCHDGDVQKGDFDFTALSRDLSNPATAILWQDLLDLVKQNEMPPKKKPRPATDDLEKFTATVESALKHEAEKAGQNDRIAIRRLSHTALDNSATDLLGAQQRLSADLPADAQVAGFDNMAETQGQSAEFLALLQRNARRLAHEVIVEGPDPRIKASFGLQQMRPGIKVIEQDGLLVISGNKNRGSCVEPKKFIAPIAGRYRVEITAYQHDNQPELRAAGKTWTFAKDKDGMRSASAAKNVAPPERPRLVSVMALTPEQQVGQPSGVSTGGRLVGTIQVDAAMGMHAVECLLDAGDSIFIHAVDTPRLQGASLATVEGREVVVGEALYLKEIGIEGPLVDAWPPRVQQSLLGGKPLEQLILSGEPLTGLHALLTRAFRHPVSEDVLARYETLLKSGKDAGLSAEAALRNVVEAVLCSPHFLYNQPFLEQKPTRAWTLASRLSYFLWNSIPDDTLLQLAASGELEQPAVIEAQVRRMLADKKVERFVNDFAGQWLGLRKVGAMLPDPKLYPDYDLVLETAMRRESEELFRHILVENRPVTEFLNPGYAMLNERLARHYGIAGVTGREFRRVALTPDHPRGGLLGQAAMLTTTSNGTRTSPVVRGIWVLENLLDSPPPPPPPNVEPLEPDVRGAKTIREMLSKHRENEGCAGCHARIDPWGFALEHFDAIGGWRDFYGSKTLTRKAKDSAEPDQKPIDATAELTDGHAFDGVTGLRDTLLARSERFTHALAAKLLAHALGHPTTMREKLLLNDIVKQHQASGGGLADLVAALCTSAPFLGK